MPINLIETGNKIKQYREKLNLSVSDVIAQLNLSDKYDYIAWENGQSLPDPDTFINMCHLFSVMPSDIIKINDFKK